MRRKLILRAAFMARAQVLYCRSVYDPKNRATHIFEPRPDDFKSAFHYLYSKLREGINFPDSSAAFIYAREIQTLD